MKIDEEEESEEEEKEEEEKSTTKYRDVRDIFGGFNEQQETKSRLRLNRDALQASRNLRSTFTAGTTPSRKQHHPPEEKKCRTTPSSPTSGSFSRPPKSPLRLPPRYDENNNGDTPPLDVTRSLSIASSINSTTPKTPKNASMRKRHTSISDDENNIILEEEEISSSNSAMMKYNKRSQGRRLSTPAERTNHNSSRNSHTFPNRNAAHVSHHKKRQSDILTTKEDSPIIGGSLGHKLDRQYRETANEILLKKPTQDEEDKEERLLVYTSQDGLSTTHYVSNRFFFFFFIY